MQKLKYLFVVGYKDGSTFIQPDHDASAILEGKSSFYDVLQRESEIETFTLFEVMPDPISGQRKVCTVSIIDGSFHVNGATFKMHDKELQEFRLIFFRKHRHDFNAAMEELNHKITYQMGWQANDAEGNNLQRIMEFD